MIEAEKGAALSQVVRQRSQTYWWLSELFLQAPDQSRIAGILERAREAARSPDDLPLKDRLHQLAAALEQSEAGALAIEHARLFAGLGASYGAIPPYESLHAGNEPREDRVVNVTDAYRDAGLERIGVPAVPQDHLGVELRFMALLCAKESEAWNHGDAEGAPSLLTRERTFLDDHLLRWVPAYCDYIVAEAREPYFAAVARMTADALALDRQNVDDLLRASARM